MAKLTTVTLVEIPYQNMLKVREVVQNSVIWYDEPEPEKKVNSVSEETSSSDEDIFNDDCNEDQSHHENYRDLVSRQVQKEFKDLIPVEFVDSKEKALTLIKSSVSTTLMVSGRAGIGLIDSLYQYGMTPPATISNVIIFCQSNKKKEKLTEIFAKKNYKVLMDIVVYDMKCEFFKPIKSKIDE